MRFVRSLLLAAVGMLCLSDMGVLVSGANPTGVITRQPLDVFLANKKQADLFYLALARMQNNALVPYTNPQSWYALAAVHGTPIKYDDVTPTNPGTTYGYCNHGDEIFPTWHRPYLSALENSLIANARAIIDALPVDKRLDGYTVADSLRLPYWNWDKIATRSTTLTLPGSASATTQTITNWLATGTSQSIPNPLLSYTIPAGPTVPTSLAGSSATPKKTGRSFTTGFRAVSLTDQINKLLSITSWKSISTHDSTTANIESVHDTLHGLVGGSMGIVGTAAYDPIFWLHHNNVDRILALYQASQPSSWVTSTGKVTRNTLMAKPGAATNATSPLWPFQWKHYSNVMVPTTQTQSTFIVSDDIKDTTKWGYSYPELDYLAKKGLTKGTTAYRAELLKFFPRDSTTFVPQATVPPARRLLQAGAQRPDEIQWTVDFETFPRDYFGGSVNVRVFVNLPTATAATSTEDAHTAAILSTFNMRGEYSATQTIGLSASITSAVSDLGILSYATGEPRVDFQHIRVVITGPAVESWLQTATPQQLAQLKKDLSSDLFTPKIKEFALYVQEDGSARNVAKRYIGVPVTITVANDGDVNGVASGSVQTLSVELNGDELITPTTTSGEASSTNNLPIIIGAAAGGAVILLVIATAIVITRRRSAHKSTVQTVQFEMTPNPAVSIDMQTSHNVRY